MNSKSSTSGSLFSRLKGLCSNLFFGFKTFFPRVKKSFTLLSKTEKYLFWLFLLITAALFSVEAKAGYIENTKTVPNFGGMYREAVVGELKYLNPILTTSDTEKSVASLIFSSLFKYDKDGNVVPDVAEKWEVSPDGLNYTVTLKNNVLFHDGEKLTAADVVYTAGTIQDPEFKSPLYETWKDIKVAATSENTVVFTLPKAYGPFIYTLDFGILPYHLSLDDFSKTIIGSGPYRFEGTKKVGDRIVELDLSSNRKYYSGRPYINKMTLNFFEQKDAALSAFQESQDYQGISGVGANGENLADASFATTKRLVLMPNLRNDKFKNKDFRSKVLSDQKLPDRTTITLSTADSELQRAKAEELKKAWLDRNIELTIKYYKPTEMKEVLNKKDYELLLFGFDFGHDRDPYIFWHSSQVDKMNYAGYSDKKSDILLEDARMITGNTDRNAKYDQFFETVKNESLGIFYEPVKFSFSISKEIHGIENGRRFDSDSKYSNIGKWYVDEKRVRK